MESNLHIEQLEIPYKFIKNNAILVFKAPSTIYNLDIYAKVGTRIRINNSEDVVIISEQEMYSINYEDTETIITSLVIEQYIDSFSDDELITIQCECINIELDYNKVVNFGLKVSSIDDEPFDNTEKFNQMVDMFKSNGNIQQTIVFEPGEYYFGSTRVLAFPNNCNIICSEGVATFTRENNEKLSQIMIGSNTNLTNINIQYFEFEIQGSNIHFTNCNSYDCYQRSFKINTLGYNDIKKYQDNPEKNAFITNITPYSYLENEDIAKSYQINKTYQVKFYRELKDTTSQDYQGIELFNDYASSVPQVQYGFVFENISFTNCNSYNAGQSGFIIRGAHLNDNDNYPNLSAVKNVRYKNCGVYNCKKEAFVIQDWCNYLQNIIYEDCIAEDGEDVGFHCENFAWAFGLQYIRCKAIHCGPFARLNTNPALLNGKYGAGFFIKSNFTFQNCETRKPFRPIAYDLNWNKSGDFHLDSNGKYKISNKGIEESDTKYKKYMTYSYLKEDKVINFEFNNQSIELFFPSDYITKEYIDNNLDINYYDENNIFKYNFTEVNKYLIYDSINGANTNYEYLLYLGKPYSSDSYYLYNFTLFNDLQIHNAIDIRDGNTCFNYMKATEQNNGMQFDFRKSVYDEDGGLNITNIQNLSTSEFWNQNYGHFVTPLIEYEANKIVQYEFDINYNGTMEYDNNYQQDSTLLSMRANLLLINDNFNTIGYYTIGKINSNFNQTKSGEISLLNNAKVTFLNSDDNIKYICIYFDFLTEKQQDKNSNYHHINKYAISNIELKMIGGQNNE